MTHYLLPLIAFAAAAGLLTITPGVDTAMVLRASASGGPKAGAGAAFGIALGLLVWGAGAAFGLTALLAASALAFTAVKWIGAGYLVLLGIKLLMKPRAAVDTPAVSKPEMRSGGFFRKGLLTNILNPKVGVFYVTFLPQFIPHGADVAVFSLVLAAVHVLLTLAWFALLIALTVPLGRALARPRVARTLDRLTGCVFLAFGAKLALTEHA